MRQHDARTASIPWTATGLAWLVVTFALVAAGTGLLWSDGGVPFSFTTLRGETVTIYGQGVYRYDTLFIGAANRGTDAVTLLVGLPLLIAGIWWSSRGSLRGSFLLVGALAYFLYVSASYALGVAFNRLLPVYIALFSASLFAFIGSFTSVHRALPPTFSPTLPHRGPAVFLIASGLVTLGVWLVPFLAATVQGRAPLLLGSYTTTITDVLDLGIIAPATFLAGAQILRRSPFGYLLACALLLLEAMLAPMIAAQTISQVAAGITFTVEQILGPMAGFGLLGLGAIWVLVALYGGVGKEESRPALSASPADGSPNVLKSA